MMADAGIFIISQSIQGIRESDWGNVWSRKAFLDCGTQEFSGIILVADDNARGREFWRRCDWEELSGALAMGKDVVAASPPMTKLE